MGSKKLSRRNFLKNAGISAAFVLGGTFNFPRLPVPSFPSRPAGEPFVPDAEISLTASEKTVQILQGAQTRVWSYTGQLVSGSGATVTNVPGSYLGPLIRVQSGTKLRMVFHNNLAEKSIVHPHGLRVPEDCDGQPMQAIDAGQSKVYEFQVIDPAGPYWFHPHPMGRTAEQVVMGLAGLLYVTDPAEERAVPGASTGANDIPLILQDRLFDGNNQFLYQPNMMWGYLGNRVLVNGLPNAAISLEPRGYRLRLLNGSNARTYKLAWSNGMAMQVIGTDGGLLEAPVSKNYLMLMPGERADVWTDFSQLAGKEVKLTSMAFQAGAMGMGGMGMGGMGMGGGGMGGMMMGPGLANGTGFDLLRVTIGQTASAKPQLGSFPAMGVHYDASNVPNFATPRRFTLGMQHMMTWAINGRVYDPTSVAEDEIVNRDQIMAWEWINSSPIPHPMHLHNARFQVIARDTSSVASSYTSVNQGLVDSGWKDTVLVWPGERVKIAMQFGPFTGMYMYHCHILEHEDMTMMRNFMIKDPQMGM
jgi:FtsP/CotA-like multicopper oxidase with cupredoxin domain